MAYHGLTPSAEANGRRAVDEVARRRGDEKREACKKNKTKKPYDVTTTVNFI